MANLKESLPQEGTFAPSHEIAIVMANKRPHKNHAHKKPVVGRIIQVNLLVFGPKIAKSLVICPTNRGRVREVNDKKPFVGRIIQVNGKWGTDNSLNLTTFAGFWTENSEKPGDLSNKLWSDNRGK